MAGKSRQIVRTLIAKAREEGLGPDDAKIYITKAPANARTHRGETVSGALNAFVPPAWWYETLRKLGQPFKYNGVFTRRYTLKSMSILLKVDPATIWRWREAGFIPDPYLTVQNPDTGMNNYFWLYHQVQPFVSWYMHFLSRGLKQITPRWHGKELRQLSRMYKQAEKRWHDRLGEDWIDPYTKVAGKYGVIWKTGPHSIDRH